jgi:hypothetical protein
MSARLRDWSDAELYKVWRATGTELVRAVGTSSVPDTATAAEARAHLLAEIERRYPRETATWIRSRGVLGGAPPRFLIDHS